MTIGTKIRVARDKLGLTQDALSALTGIPVTTIKKYESDKSVPGGDALRRLINAKISADWLLSDIGDMLIDQSAKTVLPLDSECLKLAIQTIEDALKENHKVMDTDKKSEIIMLIYEMFMESQTAETKERVLKLVKLAA